MFTKTTWWQQILKFKFQGSGESLNISNCSQQSGFIFKMGFLFLLSCLHLAEQLPRKGPWWPPSWLCPKDYQNLHLGAAYILLKYPSRYHHTFVSPIFIILHKFCNCSAVAQPLDSGSKNTTVTQFLQILFFTCWGEYTQAWTGRGVGDAVSQLPALGHRHRLEKESCSYHKLLWDYHNDTFIPSSIYTMECGEGTFLTLKIYTLESLKQKHLYLYMGPTRKNNIENKRNVPAPQVVPLQGKVALLSTRPYLIWKGSRF